MNVKAQPVKFTHDYERLQYFVKLYMQYAKAGKVALAVQCIGKIKANHPILFRLQLATVNYLIKNSKILFKMKREELYCERERVDRAVYILLYGRCKLKHDSKTLGIKMGIGYVFNEEALFVRDSHELAGL